MIVGEVVGSIVSTIKVPGLVGLKLLVVAPLEGYCDCERLVAVDLVGVGKGERVLVVRGSQVARASQQPLAADAAVVGTVERSDEAHP